MKGLGMWTGVLFKTRRARLKALGKSSLSKKELPSGSGESAAVHFAQISLLNFGDKSKKRDNDLAVVSTVETLVVAGSDEPAFKQEKEARSSGGIPSR